VTSRYQKAPKRKRLGERKKHTSVGTEKVGGAGLDEAERLVRPSKPNAASWFANFSSLWRRCKASILKGEGGKEAETEAFLSLYLIN
jgi:hypothetical protein